MDMWFNIKRQMMDMWFNIKRQVVIDNLNQMTDKHRTPVSRVKEAEGRNPPKNKENPLNDTVYLIQNENDVLRMKNDQLNLKIKELKIQLQICTDNIVLRQSEIDNVHNRVKGNTFKQDIQIENQKKLLLEKLTLLRSNEEILLRKIREAREATIFQQQKIADIHNDKKGIEMEILSMRAQNQGTKIILRNLEEENQRLRTENQKLVNKRRVYEPKERELSIEIQERIRLIKNQQQNLRNLKIYQTSKLIERILTILLKRKLKNHFTSIDQYGLNLKITKKKIFHLSLLRKRYVLFIKNKILQQLREPFKPLVEQETARRIISETHKRRAKAIIWRKWRKASKQAEYKTIRRFQFQNLLQKIGESFIKCNLYSAFNTLKYYKNNPFKERAAISIEHTFSQFMHRSKTLFFSALRSAQNQYQIGLEIDASSKEQTEMLIQSLYFTALAKLTKSHKIQNRSVIRRYFKELKKLIALKNRRKLGQMLMKTNDKIKNVDTQSKIFTTIKKQALVSRIHHQNEQHYAIETKSKELQDQLLQMQIEKKQLYQELSLLKVSKYLKTKMQKAFDIWRLRKQQSKVIMSIMNTIQSKKTFDKNFAFCKILKKRFFMLKKSIRDKIASCEFSYNYLLDENKHIKEVLDKKQHELEKTKFTNIIKRIIKAEKEIKLKYFFKFLKNGFKYWKFRKTVQRIDKMVDKKVKIVFMWILKETIRTEKEELRVENAVVEKEKTINLRLIRNSIYGFRSNVDRNRRLRRVIGGIFQRNLELDFYLAFGKVRNEEHLQNRGELQKDINRIKGQTEKRNAVAVQQQQKAKILTNRLKDKEQIFEQRKILTLYLFYTKSIVKKVSSYIQKWKKKVQRQNRVTNFAEILERKSRVFLKNKFLLAIHKKNEDFILNDLKDKLKKYQHQYEQGSHSLQQFVSQSQQQSSRMKEENQLNKSSGEYLQKKTDFMTNIKIKSFTKAWAKKLLTFAFKYWRKETDKFIHTWTRLNNKYSTQLVKQSFIQFVKEMQYTLQNDRIRKNLSRIYHNSFLHNAGLGFRVWRFVYLHKKNQIWSYEEKRQMKRFEGLENKYNYAVTTHNKQVDFRLFDSLNRSVFNQWRKYAETEVLNKQKKSIAQKLLIKSYSSQFMRLLKQRVSRKIQFKARLKVFQRKWTQIRMKAFMTESLFMKIRRKIFERLFVHKFLPFLKYKVFEDFFSRVKNYNNCKENQQLTDKTNRIQKVIETFEKKRKSILNVNVRKWRRNQYVMRIQKNLLKRITQNAMNWRVRDLFYSWKLESEAKKVKIMHEEEGEVKKRKIEIMRLKIFLEDFKKEKGLLLENEAGQLVVSPRFQEKKEQQIKKDNNYRYKFISRLILSMNGYSAPVKAYNNLRMYMFLREKYKKFALMARNNLRKPQVHHAFRIWHKASKDFNKMFQIMQRKDLIKILNRQKDKMEMEYSKKVTLQEKILDQMKVHKVLAYQEDRKEKLCAHVFIKNLRKVQFFGLNTWKKRVSQMKEAELFQLEEQGNSKITNLQEEVNDLEQMQRELRENNDKLEMAVREALQIAEMVKRITEQRDILSNLLAEKQFTCESLQQQNQDLNAKLHLAQKQAMNLLILSGERL